MKKIGLLLLALVVALGSLGVGYALWTQSLTVYGTANTGYLSASFNPDVRFQSVPYTTSSFTITSDGKLDDADQLLNNELNIVLDNVYPGYSQTVTFWIDNNGTIPFYASVNPADITVLQGGWSGTPVTDVFTFNADINNEVIVEPGYYNATAYTLEINIPGEDGPLVDETIDPDQNSHYYITVPLTVTQSLP
jgi:hypothetical protein